MSNEHERLKRLRERQLTDRDPLVKQRQFQRTTAQKERKVRGKRYSLGEAWRTIPHIYRSPFIGLIFGAVVIFLLPMVWISEWALWVGLAVTFFFVLIGLLVGRALDIREDLKDAIKH